MDITILKEGEKVLLQCGVEMFKANGEKMFGLDLFILGILKRSVLLISGFSTLIVAKNFLSASSLIRLHLDSLLQLYGARIVKDPHNYALHKLQGKETKKYKCKNGNAMTDGYLKKSFFGDKENDEFLGLMNVYSETSGFIHFSEKHIFMAINKLEGSNFEASIGPEMEVSDEANKEAINAMYMITRGILKYVIGRTATKNLRTTE